MDRRFVDHVLSAEIVTRAEMQRLILQARKEKTGLVQQLLGEKTVSDEMVADAVATYFEHPKVEAEAFAVDPTAVKLISGQMARDNSVLPFLLEDGGDTVAVAVSDPEGADSVIDMLRSATGNEPKVLIAQHSWLARLIDHHYFGADLPNEGGARSDSFSVPLTMEAPSVDDPNATRLAPQKNGDSGLIVIDEPSAPASPHRPKSNPRGSALGRIKPKKRRASELKKPKDDREELAQALEDFDTFLDQSGNFLAGPASQRVEEDVDPFSLDEDDSGFGGFDLFGEEHGLDESTSVEDKMARQEETIRQLVRELKQQRDIIQAMASLLEEKGVLSKRDLKRRARGR